jgi:hypothetical protein
LIIKEEDYLMHYGILQKSGRYPWGSGGDQSARNQTFLSTINGLKKQGLSDAQIADHFAKPGDPKNMWTSTRVRALKSIANEDEKLARIRRAERLRSEGKSNVEIGKAMGNINESSVRSLLAPSAKEKAQVIEATAAMLRDQVAKKGYIDIGAGTHHDLPNDLKITGDKLKVAVAKLEEEGYKKHYQNVTTTIGNETSLKVLGAPGSAFPKDVSLIKTIADQTSPDGGHTFQGIQTPMSISSKRIAVRHAEDGGADADGVMYIRPGKKDLDIGENQYAQVRVMVDKTHYLKGMAIKKDDLPDGIDIVFNTNKPNTGNKLDALKPIKSQEEDFFGAIVRQVVDPKTQKVTSAMNIVGQKDGAGVEGGWGAWSKSLSSQVLSKQKPSLAKEQLALTEKRSRDELDELKALTNPTVKHKLLMAYADNTDSKAVDLKAAELPGQATHVLLPVNSMKKDQVYATNYNNGDRVVLIRYPHGGTFEIPELVVNNNNPEAKKLLGESPQDAVGVHHSVAQRLSGADFDGDTVLVIPNNMGTIAHTPALEGLRGFDPQTKYKIPKENTTTPRMSKKNTQTEMGKITNLISDMTIKGAGPEDLAYAVKHSMVVIDAEKHGLDYKASYKDNKIASLKRQYQGVSETGNVKGASTLITRAKSLQYVDDRKLRLVPDGGPIDPKTGELRFTPTGKMKTGYSSKTGTVDPSKIGPVQMRSKKLAETNDARSLISLEGTRIERVYADHSNRMKGLANEARLESLKIVEPAKSPSAARTYAPEVESLKAKLRVAEANSPRERQAQIVAKSMHKLKKQDNPEWSDDEVKKDQQRSLARARVITGADKEKVVIEPKEWEAIQAGAIPKTSLRAILANTDLDKVKALATPRPGKLLDAGKTSRAKQMLANGQTQAEVARALGVSLSTLKAGLA